MNYTVTTQSTLLWDVGNVGGTYTTRSYTATENGWVKAICTGDSSTGFCSISNGTTLLEITDHGVGLIRVVLPVKTGDSITFGWQNASGCLAYLIH